MLTTKTIVKKCVWVFAFVFFVVVPLGVMAAETECLCFCGTEAGAEQKTEMSAIACKNLCADEAKSIAACAYTPAEYPGQNPNCFTESQCDQYKGTLGEKQPPECVAGQFYCYYDSAKAGDEFGLAVAIGDVTSVTDLSEYIQVVFTWLLGASLMIAIVLTMVGGIQYVLAAGGASSTQNAIDRMKNSAIGIVLLFSVYVILYTVNPQLVQLNFNHVPMMKTVSYIDNTSCEYLQGRYSSAGGSVAYTIANGASVDSPYVTESYTIETSATNPACGDVGLVKKDSQGNAMAEGSTCNYEYCADGAKCVGHGTTRQCVHCIDVDGTFTNHTGIDVSATSCAELSPGALYYPNGSLKTMGFCAAVAGNEFMSVSTSSAIPADVCALISVDCAQVKKCSDYDGISVQTGGTVPAGLKLDDLSADAGSTVTIDDICLRDTQLCNVGPCEMDRSLLNTGCIDKE